MLTGIVALTDGYDIGGVSNPHNYIYCNGREFGCKGKLTAPKVMRYIQSASGYPQNFVRLDILKHPYFDRSPRGKKEAIEWDVSLLALD